MDAKMENSVSITLPEGCPKSAFLASRKSQKCRAGQVSHAGKGGGEAVRKLG